MFDETFFNVHDLGFDVLVWLNWTGILFLSIPTYYNFL